MFARRSLASQGLEERRVSQDRRDWRRLDNGADCRPYPDVAVLLGHVRRKAAAAVPPALPGRQYGCLRRQCEVCVASTRSRRLGGASAAPAHRCTARRSDAGDAAPVANCARGPRLRKQFVGCASVTKCPLNRRSSSEVTSPLLASKGKGRLCAFSCSVSLSPSRLHFCSAVPAIHPRRLELRQRTSIRDGYMTCSASQQPQSDATSMPRPVRPTSPANTFPSHTQGMRSRSSRTTSSSTALATPTIQSGLHAGDRRSSGSTRFPAKWRSPARLRQCSGMSPEQAPLSTATAGGALALGRGHPSASDSRASVLPNATFRVLAAFRGERHYERAQVRKAPCCRLAGSTPHRWID